MSFFCKLLILKKIFNLFFVKKNQKYLRFHIIRRNCMIDFIFFRDNKTIKDMEYGLVVFYEFSDKN